MGSVKNNDKNNNSLHAVFRKAFELCDTGKSSEADDEYIAMIAEGRISEFSESERTRLLDVIAADTESAMLLKKLSDAGIISCPQTRNRLPIRKLAIAWAAAACMMIGLLTWKTMDTTGIPGHYHDTTPYSTKQDDPDYWSQLEKKRLSSSELRSRYRDYALILSTSATFVLAVLVAVGFLRNSKKKDSAS